MLPAQREAVILTLLQQESVVSIETICAQCSCSPVTARRDLARLEDSGLLRRTHGGAVTLDGHASPPCGPANLSAMEARLALIDRADALIVTPNDTAATRALVERARRAGAPVVAEAYRYSGALTLVAIDDYRAGLELGRATGQYARQHFTAPLRVLEVSHPLPNTEARSRGFTDGLRETFPGERNVVSIDGGGSRGPARTIVAEVLALHPDVDVIFAINDDSILGAVDAWRAHNGKRPAPVVAWFGLEGKATRDLLAQGELFKLCAAMFPEVVGRACVDATVCAYHDCALPDRITTPFAIVTQETLDRYYLPDDGPDGWRINWPAVEKLTTGSAGYLMLGHASNRPKPARLAWIQILSSHDWYRAVRRAMQERARELGIQLEVMDASQDMAQEIDAVKRNIGCAAARLISDGDTVIIDGGVTTTYMAQALRGRQGITVITNSVGVLSELVAERGITLLSSGGVVRSQSQSLTGPSAEATFLNLRADKAFIAGTGLSVNFGLSNTNVQEAGVKQAMLRAAREVVLLADHTKIGVESLVKIAPIESIHRLITDVGISAHDRQSLAQLGIEVIIAN
jgi:DeoR/GlpR family transcriptional regulator of sugar metabolism